MNHHVHEDKWLLLRIVYAAKKIDQQTNKEKLHLSRDDVMRHCNERNIFTANRTNTFRRINGKRTKVEKEKQTTIHIRTVFMRMGDIDERHWSKQSQRHGKRDYKIEKNLSVENSGNYTWKHRAQCSKSGSSKPSILFLFVVSHLVSSFCQWIRFGSGCDQSGAHMHGDSTA